MEILHDTGRLVPFKKISSALKRNIVVNAISHVEEMLIILEENNISLGNLKENNQVIQHMTYKTAIIPSLFCCKYLLVIPSTKSYSVHEKETTYFFLFLY